MPAGPAIDMTIGMTIKSSVSRMENRLTPPRHLLALMALYCAASLAHFVHNARFLADYPNMPAWLTPLQVMGAWLVVTAPGVLGLLLLRMRWPLAGLLLIGVCACLGFDGLAHYTLAPMGPPRLALTLTMGSVGVAAAVRGGPTALLVLKRLRPLPAPPAAAGRR